MYLTCLDEGSERVSELQYRLEWNGRRTRGHRRRRNRFRRCPLLNRKSAWSESKFQKLGRNLVTPASRTDRRSPQRHDLTWRHTSAYRALAESSSPSSAGTYTEYLRHASRSRATDGALFRVRFRPRGLSDLKISGLAERLGRLRSRDATIVTSLLVRPLSMPSCMGRAGLANAVVRASHAANCSGLGISEYSLGPDLARNLSLAASDSAQQTSQPALGFE